MVLFQFYRVKLARGLSLVTPVPASRLRLAVPADGDSLARIYRPAVVEHATSFELEPPDGAEMGRRVAAITASLPWLVAELDDGITGYAYASRHRERAAYRWCIDVSVYVDSAARRGGIARTLYRALFELLVLQRYRNAYAGITLPNQASERFHEHMGFTRVGVYRQVGYKFGRWHDVAWYERDLAERVQDPPEPLPLAAVVGLPEFAKVLGAP